MCYFTDGDKIIVHVEREFVVKSLGETKVLSMFILIKHQGADDEWGLDVEDEDFEDLDPDFLDQKKGK